MTRVEWTRAYSEPWRDERLIAGALDLAVDVRDIEPAELLSKLSNLPPETMLHLLVATAALVDIDQPVSQLLAWSSQHNATTGWCTAGRHLMVGDNVAFQRNGAKTPSRVRRCRACQRERQAAASARRKMQQVAS